MSEAVIPSLSLYMASMKALLGMRTSTHNLNCLLEAGLHQYRLSAHKAKFLSKTKYQLDMHHDQFGYILKLTGHKKNQIKNSYLIQIIYYIRLVCDEVIKNA